MEMNLKRKMFLVGDIFMRKYYGKVFANHHTIFDRDNHRVGLVPVNSPEKVIALQ